MQLGLKNFSEENDAFKIVFSTHAQKGTLVCEVTSGRLKKHAILNALETERCWAFFSRSHPSPARKECVSRLNKVICTFDPEDSLGGSKRRICAVLVGLNFPI